MTEQYRTRATKTAEHEHFKGIYSFTDENGRPMIAAPADTHVVKSKKQLDAYMKKKLQGRKHEHTRTDMEAIKEVILKIDENYCGYLLYLMCLIDYTGTVVDTQNKPMNKLTLTKTLGIKERAYQSFMTTMKRNDIIRIDENGAYVINSRYHFRGKAENLQTIKAFTTKVKSMYGDVKPKDLGFVYKLLPYVHFETNTICHNPYDRTGKVHAMNVKEIANITGATEKTVYSKIRRLKFGDEYVFAQLEVKRGGKSVYYKINPFLFYRKNGRPDATLREVFLVSNSTF